MLVFCRNPRKKLCLSLMTGKENVLMSCLRSVREQADEVACSRIIHMRRCLVEHHGHTALRRDNVTESKSQRQICHIACSRAHMIYVPELPRALVCKGKGAVQRHLGISALCQSADIFTRYTSERRRDRTSKLLGGSLESLHGKHVYCVLSLRCDKLTLKISYTLLYGGRRGNSPRYY